MLKVYNTLAVFIAVVAICYTAPARNQKVDFHVGIGKSHKDGFNSGNYNWWYKQLVAVQAQRLAQLQNYYFNSLHPAYYHPRSQQPREQYQSVYAQYTADPCMFTIAVRKCIDLCKPTTPEVYCDNTIGLENIKLTTAEQESFLAKLQAAFQDEKKEEDKK